MTVIPMARPARRARSSYLQFRQRIPREILEKARGRTLVLPLGEGFHTLRITPKAEAVALSLKTRDPAEAKQRAAEIGAHLSKVWEGIRNGPQPLTQRQRAALAGDLYRGFLDALGDNPGGPERWERVIRANARALAGHSAAVPFSLRPPSAADRTRALDERFGAFADALFARYGLEVTPEDREAVMLEGGIALAKAAERLRRNASGDWRDDPDGDTYPVFEAPREAPAVPQASPSTTLRDLYVGWLAEARARARSPRTFSAYRGALRHLERFLGHGDVRRITQADIIAFKDQRLADGISVTTVRGSDLAGLNAVFNWAVENGRMGANPAFGVRLGGARRIQLRDPGLSDGEAKALLAAALGTVREGREDAKTAHARRWVPWLLAYTGARVGEVVQLRKQDVGDRGGIPFIRITPEAGTVKTGQFREVPLHADTVRQGFLQFAQDAPEGHLFITPKDPARVDGVRQSRINRLREWARTIVADSGVSPQHGWRHRFKTVGREAGIEEGTLDAICGHAPTSIGRSYGTVTLRTMARAMEKFPEQG